MIRLIKQVEDAATDAAGGGGGGGDSGVSLMVRMR